MSARTVDRDGAQGSASAPLPPRPPLGDTGGGSAPTEHAGRRPSPREPTLLEESATRTPASLRSPTHSSFSRRRPINAVLAVWLASLGIACTGTVTESDEVERASAASTQRSEHWSCFWTGDVLHTAAVAYDEAVKRPRDRAGLQRATICYQRAVAAHDRCSESGSRIYDYCRDPYEAPAAPEEGNQ